MSGRNPGPPPVGNNQGAVPPSRSLEVQRYEDVQERFREAALQRALLGMFNNDKQLRDRFLAVTFSLLAKKSDLLRKASPASIVQSIRDAAAWGLEPLTDECAIIEYDGIAQAQPMWRGYLKRIRNSGKVSNVDAQLVYENDIFELSLGTEPSVRHVPARVEKRQVLVDPNDESKGYREEIVRGRGGFYGAYAWALFPDGSRLVEWMELAEIIAVRDQFSKGYKWKPENNPWTTSFGEMARKTVLRRLAKRLPGAAVDVLLAADAALDEKQRQLDITVSKVQEQTEDLRQLAMTATGMITAGGNDEQASKEGSETEAGAEAAETPTVTVLDGQGQSQEGSEAKPVNDPAPPTDPNVAAAMEMARQQEQMRRGSGPHR